MPEASVLMLDLLLPWFPVVLAAAVGARLLASTSGTGGRGTWLGITCSLFWVVVVQTNVGVPFWHDPVMFASLLSGTAAIVGMAHWSERHGESANRMPTGAEARSAYNAAKGGNDHASEFMGELKAVSDAIGRFDDWLDAHRGDADVWPAFDEFVRHVLFACCGASHARPYRILSEGAGLVPLRTMESAGVPSPGELESARRGIVGHVAMTGRTFLADDASQGTLIQKLADQPAGAGRYEGPAWCFAIRAGARTIGVVSIGQFGAMRPTQAGLRAIEALIGQFWTTLSEVCRSRSAVTRDPVSGFMTREAFLDEGRRMAESAYAVGEPVAVAVIQIEGLRALLDGGQWSLADEVLHEVSAALRHRLRPDDLIGRFDDARVVLLLRRVDSELASLIADQFVERLTGLHVLRRVMKGDMELRCGVSGSGALRVPIERLTSEALRLCRLARERRVRTVTDVFEAGREGGTKGEALKRERQEHGTTSGRE